MRGFCLAVTAPKSRNRTVAVVHRSLERRGLLPGEHLVDKGYTDSQVLVEGPRRYGVTIVGPVAADTGWQARVEGGLTKAAFRVDRDSGWRPARLASGASPGCRIR